jgi:glycolate oxidase FAD binding subunit
MQSEVEKKLDGVMKLPESWRMTPALQPASLGELTEAVRSASRVLAVGAGTKPRLSAVDTVKLSLARLTGVTEYEPSEFTITALAGTPVREIAATLAQRGQFLPFDPLLVEAGATLGGTVASGLSGPGRLRFGGLRDFILGVRFVDGAGRLLRAGGKVVKNAAGFDLPKFFVGSLGRFGVLAETTFKVFPRPASTLTLKLPVHGAEAAAQLITEASGARWEPAAVDLLAGGKAVCLRLAGPSCALQEMSREILARWPGAALSDTDAETIWSDLREFRWAYANGLLAKVALTPAAWPALERSLGLLDGARAHLSAGGSQAFISLPFAAPSGLLDESLRGLGLPAVTLRGNASLWLGARPRSNIALAVKEALDPEGRFPGLDD